MSLSAISRRYQVSSSQASRLRQYLAAYGVDGRYRYLDGTPKPKQDS
jgi:hypothetical protein